MPTVRVAATGIVFLLFLISLFQFALACGAPLGEFAMGGAFKGTYPPAMRAAAMLQVIFYAAAGVIVLSRAEVAFPKLRRPANWLMWPIVVLFGAAAVLNLISPSVAERLLWTPVAVVILLLGLRVALHPASRSPGPR
jgi:hypothetical protein